MKYEYEKTFTFEGKRYHVYGHSEEEVIEKKALKLRDLKEGRVTVNGNMLVSLWAEKCLDIYKPNVSPKYKEQMEYRIKKNILSIIGNMPICSVKPLQCQEILNNLSGMSKSHITKVYQELCFIFDKAVENKLILESPAAHLVRPEGIKGKRRSLTEKERKHLLNVCEEPRFYLFLLMLYCGCRPTEAINCQGKDICYVDGIRCLHIRGTKTDNADRKVPLPEVLYEKIKDTEPFSYISPNAAGNKHSESSYKRLTDSLRRELNLSMGCRTYRNQLVPPFPLAEDFTPYMLRHTFCTDLQKMGVDVRAASKLMGHADIRTTANIYTHQDNETLRQAAEKMGVVSGVVPCATGVVNS